MPFRISVVIPTLNEEAYLAATVASVRSAKTDIQIIICDGGSNDNTVPLAKQLGCEVVHSVVGRATQMNCGTEKANGDVLLFLHADTQLPDDFCHQISRVMSDPKVGYGAFPHRINSPRWSLRVIECFDQLRARWFKLPYGDQPLFVRRDLFQQCGGFPQVEILEDVLILEQLKKQSDYAMASSYAVTNARRWHCKGVLRTTLTNWLVMLGHFCGVSNQRLARLYRGHGTPPPNDLSSQPPRAHTETSSMSDDSIRAYP